VIENYTIENVGGHVGDQNGCVGNNKKLLNTGWMPSVTFENGIQQFLTYIKRTL
jgi:nucleoside-diphosphate-sugar epimerase